MLNEDFARNLVELIPSIDSLANMRSVSDALFRRSNRPLGAPSLSTKYCAYSPPVEASGVRTTCESNGYLSELQSRGDSIST